MSWCAGYVKGAVVRLCSWELDSFTSPLLGGKQCCHWFPQPSLAFKEQINTKAPYSKKILLHLCSHPYECKTQTVTSAQQWFSTLYDFRLISFLRGCDLCRADSHCLLSATVLLILLLVIYINRLEDWNITLAWEAGILCPLIEFQSRFIWFQLCFLSGQCDWKTSNFLISKMWNIGF